MNTQMNQQEGVQHRELAELLGKIYVSTYQGRGNGGYRAMSSRLFDGMIAPGTLNRIVKEKGEYMPNDGTVVMKLYIKVLQIYIAQGD